jgi:hypothetical protein
MIIEKEIINIIKVGYSIIEGKTTEKQHPFKIIDFIVVF